MAGYRDPNEPSILTDLFDAVSPPVFLAILVAAVAWLPASMWLQLKLDWPDRYGWHCAGRGCWIADMWHSPALLRQHTPYELGLFACIWMPAAALIGVAMLALRKNPSGQAQPTGVRSSVFDAEVEADRRRKILTAGVASVVVGLALLAILLFKGTR